jgi:hypothetical protein
MVLYYSINECRAVLLHHIFSGQCILELNNNDNTACSHFREEFQSVAAMSFSAFEIMASASAKQCSTDDLIYWLCDLEIKTL